MNRLTELYNYMSGDPGLFGLYTSIGKTGHGNMFSFLNTNYRAILNRYSRSRYGYGGFAQGFGIIEDVEGLERGTWSRTNNAGQEVEKQHTGHMRKAYLFQVKDNAFRKTSRGEAFKRMLLDKSLSDMDKRLLCYLFILPSSFSETKNYIFSRTAKVFSMLEKQGISNKAVLESIEAIIRDYNRLSRNKFRKNLFKYEYVYYDSFFNNTVDFLQLWSGADGEEKAEFMDGAAKSRPNILSKKYESGGNYTSTTVIENAWLLYVTKHIIDSGATTSFEEFLKIVLRGYGYLFPIQEKKIRKFVFDPNGNRSVFQVIYCELYNIRVPLEEVAKDLTQDEIEAYGTIDPTDEDGYSKREGLSAALKKLAKRKAGFKCECENAEGCRYFTAKESGEAYLEIHHLIPREFTNDYDVSIEKLENYIALCPNCHRKIHLAADRERRHLVQLLYNMRKERLNAANLPIDLPKILDYYKIDERA